MGLPMFDLTDRVAIVTEVVRGLGRAVALGFAEVGVDVVVCARSSAEIEDMVAKIIGEQMVGNIINMGSVVGLGPYGALLHYNAAKAGVINFSQS